MMQMTSFTVTLSMDGGIDMRDLTDRVRSLLTDHALTEGQATVYCRHTTAGLFVMEWRDDVRFDITAAIRHFVDTTCPDRRAESQGAHIGALLASPSITIPIIGGRLMLGAWQYIVFVDFDATPRSREVIIQLVG